MSCMCELSLGHFRNIFMSLYLIFIKNNMDAGNIIQKKNADVQFTRSESLEEIICVLSHKKGSVFTVHLKLTQRIEKIPAFILQFNNRLLYRRPTLKMKKAV